MTAHRFRTTVPLKVIRGVNQWFATRHESIRKILPSSLAVSCSRCLLLSYLLSSSLFISFFLSRTLTPCPRLGFSTRINSLRFSFHVPSMKCSLYEKSDSQISNDQISTCISWYKQTMVSLVSCLAIFQEMQRRLSTHKTDYANME